MRTTLMTVTILTVWALPAQAERNAERPAVHNRDALPLVMAVQLSEADQTHTHITRSAAQPALRKLGPAPKVHLTPEQIAGVAGDIQAGASGDVLIVDCHGNFDHDTIQGAIDAASDGDVIVVLPNTCTQDGHYFENINFLGKAITIQSLLPEDPEIVEATVVNGSTNDLSVVRFVSSEGLDSVLAGLTLTGGSGTPVEFNSNEYPGYLFHFGGAVVCVGSSPTVRSCRIVGNQATFGGGLGGLDASPEISECTFLQNLVFVEVQTVEFTLALFADGGGLGFLGTCFPVVSNCQIVENESHAEHDYDLGGFPPRIAYGGGIAVWGQNVAAGIQVSNCELRRNRIVGAEPDFFPSAGGGLLSVDVEEMSILNTLVSGNSAPHVSGIAEFEDNSAVLRGCTVVDNVSHDEQFAVRRGGVIQDTIIQQNIGGDYTGQAEITFSNVGTIDGLPFPGEGNVNADPLFVDPENGDYHLTADSPCVDTGNPKFVPEEGETDLDGNPRIVDGNDDGEGVVDMGAYEFQGMLACPQDVNGDGIVGPFDLASLLGWWGPCDPSDPCHQLDANSDGTIGPFDLASLLGVWGPCP